MSEKYEERGFLQSPYFYKGNLPLTVGVNGSGFDRGRLFVSSYNRLGLVAPVVVVEQARAPSQAKPTKTADGIVVPTEKFNAAKKAFRNAEHTMRPDLADAFRAVFGE